MTEFTKVQECIEYCNANNLAFFRRDLNSNFAKIMVADSFNNIFNKIKAGDNKFYESWSPNQYMKLYIDYERKATPYGDRDYKNNETSLAGPSCESDFDFKKRLQRINEEQLSHKNDILNIINHIKSLLPNIIGVYLLKSIPDTDKKSYHIIFDGIHFTNYRNIKLFVEEQLRHKFKDLFDKKIIDTTVYAPKCFRSLLCSKFGQNRPLFLLDTNAFLSGLDENIISKDATTFEMFKKTCVTYIEGSSVLYTYKSMEKKKDAAANKKLHLISDGDIYSDKDVVKKYLDILDADRYTDRNKWLNIGYILYSLSPEYRDLWHYFSSRWENYNEDECDKTWDSFNNNEFIYTIHNLIHLARIDNPDDFNELSHDIPNHDIKYIRPFDNIISKVIYRLYGERFVCSNPEKNEWYYFNNIRWIKENKSYNLRKLMINEVFTRVEGYRKQLIREGASEEMVKNYHMILKILGSGNKLNCLELEFFNNNFYKIIDQNKDIIGFENGIYDLTKMEFRKGDPSDYVSMSTGYEYKEYTPQSSEYRDLMSLLSKILPHEETRHFTLKSLASCLDGHVRDENFYIWSGKSATGGNGKTTILDLLLKALGEYACTAPVSLITGKRESANSANSALANIINKRAVIMQEPEANEMIQAGVMKSLTGGDNISTRELNSSQMEFKPMAKLFMACNRQPMLSDSDGGTIRRLKLTEFISRFVENPSPEPQNGIYEFKIDKDLKSKLEHYKSVFMCILLNYYKTYRSEGIVPPMSVIKVTKKYESDNNLIKDFIDEYIQESDKSEFIAKDELKNIYKNDYTLKANFGKFNNFIGRLENTLCTEFKLDTKKRIYKLSGYVIRTKGLEDDDDDEEDDKETNNVTDIDINNTSE
jgi:P4 family phage/plasmid primase-like protien